MKSSQRPASPSADAAQVPSNAHRVATALTADLITDAAIRALLARARWSRDVGWVKRCCRALRPAARCRTAAEVHARRAARLSCADEINLGATAWLRDPKPQGRLFAVLAGVAPPDPATTWARLPRRVSAQRTVPAPLVCCRCKQWIEPYQDHEFIRRRRGQRRVHLECPGESPLS